MQRKIVVSLTALFLLSSVLAFAASGEKAKVKGMIISRTGETLIVSTKGEKTTVVLTDATKTQDKTGLFGLGRTQMSSAVLIPGLKLEVDGVSDDQGRVVAKTITVDGDDLESAEMIQAGLHPTAEQVAANLQNIQTNKQNIGTNKQNIEGNKQDIAANKAQIAENIKDIEEHSKRFDQLSEFDVKGEATVKFRVGSSKVSTADQAALKKLAETATGLTGYIIEVKGFADSSGQAAMNTKLSEDRAKAVVAHLIQHCNVPIRHIVAPGAFGEYQPAASNETKAGRAENRRVEVKILVNKGIAGS
jgi:OOP family OmpA-OmpF porin